MFGLLKQESKLLHVNARSEVFGEEQKLALDLKIECKTINNILDEFADGLRRALYWKAAEGKVGELFDGHLPDVRFPLLAPIKWGKEYAGYALIIAHGIQNVSALIIDQCELNNFVFEPLQGGAVIMTCRVICHPVEIQAAQILGMIQSVITISLIPPALEIVKQQPQSDWLDAPLVCDKPADLTEAALKDFFEEGTK